MMQGGIAGLSFRCGGVGRDTDMRIVSVAAYESMRHIFELLFEGETV